MNQTRQILESGGCAVGGEAASGFEGTVLAYAAAGLDFVWIDLEHTLLDPSAAGRMIRLARQSSITPIVRVPGLDPFYVRRLVDNGAQGIILPYTEDPASAETLVAACRFPPRGRRGVGSPLYANDMRARSLAEHVRDAEDVLVIVQIESARGVDLADAIASVDGVDAIVLGLADLSVSLGVPGELDHALVVSAAEQVFAACNAAGVVGGVAGTPEMAAWVRRGARFLQAVNDVHLIAEGAVERAAHLRAEVAAGSAPPP
jgi:4-hydroxy-2-oxoheptanedioate aldolase